MRLVYQLNRSRTTWAAVKGPQYWGQREGRSQRVPTPPATPREVVSLRPNYYPTPKKTKEFLSSAFSSRFQLPAPASFLRLASCFCQNFWLAVCFLRGSAVGSACLLLPQQHFCCSIGRGLHNQLSLHSLQTADSGSSSQSI